MAVNRWFVRDENGNIVAGLAGNIESLVFHDVGLGPSGWVLKVDATQTTIVDTLKTNGAGIVHIDTFDASFGDLTGTVWPSRDGTAWTLVSDAERDLYEFRGYTDRSMLWHRVVLPKTSETNWEKSAQAASAQFSDFWNDQFGSGAGALDTTRENTLYDLEGSGGPLIAFDFPRYETVGPHIAAVFDANDLFIETRYDTGNNDIKWKVTQVDTVDMPVSVDTGSILRETHSRTADTANRVYALGQGRGTDRDIEEVNDNGGDVWRLLETSIDRRDIDKGDTTALNNAATDAVQKGHAGVTVEPSAAFDLMLGDRVQLLDRAAGTYSNMYVVGQTVTISGIEETRTVQIGASMGDIGTAESAAVSSSAGSPIVYRSDQQLGPSTQYSLTEQFDAAGFTTSVGASWTALGSGTHTITAPDDWGTFDVTVVAQVRYHTPAGYDAAVRARCKIDGTAEDQGMRVVSNASSSTEPDDIMVTGHRSGMTTDADITFEGYTDWVSTGTTLDFILVRGYVTIHRVT